MTEDQVKSRLFRDFLAWMAHQTVGIYDDGHTNYYDYDVANYCYQVRKRVVEPYAGVDD